jgi:hypothetical protein
MAYRLTTTGWSLLGSPNLSRDVCENRGVLAAAGPRSTDELAARDVVLLELRTLWAKD